MQSYNKEYKCYMTRSKSWDDKEEILARFSRPGVEHFSQVPVTQQKELIDFLQKKATSMNQMRQKIYAIARELGWGKEGATPKQRDKAIYAAIDDFLKEKGAVKKPYQALKKDELVLVATQFEELQKNIILDSKRKASHG